MELAPKQMLEGAVIVMSCAPLAREFIRSLNLGEQSGS